MSDFLTGLNMAWLTVPVLLACAGIAMAIFYLDHRDKRRPRS